MLVFWSIELSRANMCSTGWEKESLKLRCARNIMWHITGLSLPHSQENLTKMEVESEKNGKDNTRST